MALLRALIRLPFPLSMTVRGALLSGHSPQLTPQQPRTGPDPASQALPYLECSLPITCWLPAASLCSFLITPIPLTPLSHPSAAPPNAPASCMLLSGTRVSLWDTYCILAHVTASCKMLPVFSVLPTISFRRLVTFVLVWFTYNTTCHIVGVH